MRCRDLQRSSGCSYRPRESRFGERLAQSPGLLTLQLAGGAIAAAGITVLSRSPVTLAEERRESQSASPHVVQAPEPADRLAGKKQLGSC